MSIDNKQINYSDAQLLEIIVGLTLSEATDKLAQLGYTANAVFQQKRLDNSTSLVIGCSKSGNTVTIYLGDFVLSPQGKPTTK